MQKCEDNVAARLNGNALQPLAGILVTVTDDATSLPASLYSDDGVTPLPQPLITDDNGYYGFYAANGEYTLTFTGVRITTFTRKVVLADPSDNPYATKAELAAGSGSNLVTFLQAGAGAVPLPVQDELRGAVSVRQFGAGGRGATNDQDAILAAYASISATISKNRTLHFPAGTYNVDQLVFIDVQDFTFFFDGAVFVGVSTTARDAVFKLVNAYNVKLVGAWSVVGSANYGCAVALKAAPGGVLQPTLGLVSRVGVENLTAYNTREALQIGAYDSDAQVAETTFTNFNAIGCPLVAHVSGSQTGVSFVGGNLTSEPNGAYSGAQECAIRSEGAFVSTSGTELTLTNSATGKTIWLNPAQSATYSNPYGSVRVNGGHIESASPLAFVSNPRALATPYSGLSQIVVSGSGGYVSPALNAANLIEISDASYGGRVQVFGNNFYGGIGNVRAAFNIYSASGSALIETDRASWGTGFQDWMGGVSGGTLRHPLELAVYADNLNNQSVTNGATATLAFIAKATGGKFQRYASAYDATTGIFTVPAGGLKTLRIAANAKATAGTPVGSVGIYRNGALDVGGWLSGANIGVAGDFFDVPGGTTFAVRMVNTSGGAVGFGVSGGDRLTISIAN